MKKSNQEVEQVEIIGLDIPNEEPTKEEDITPLEEVVTPLESEEDKKAKDKEAKELIKAKAKELREKAKNEFKELRDKLIENLQNKNKDYKENIAIKETSKYVGVRYKGKVISELELVGRGLIVRVLDIYGDTLEEYDNEYNERIEEHDLLIRKCPKRFAWRTNTEHLMQGEQHFKQCLNALDLSVKFEIKKAKEKELEKKAKEKEAKEQAKEKAKKEKEKAKAKKK